MKIIQCDQGTPEWFSARRGVATASEFGRIITPKKGKVSDQADTYACEIIAEMFMDDVPENIESYTNRAMQHGIDYEPEARAWYEMWRDCKVNRVGFCLTDCGRFGCSPDGLIGDDGGLELKCPQPATHVRYLIDGELPSQYRWQVHGALVVTGRKWWDFVSYAHGFPPLLIRVEPDESTELLRDALETFWREKFSPALAKIESLGGYKEPSVHKEEELIPW